MHVSSKTRKEIKRKGAKALAVFLAFVLAAQSVNLPAVVAVANTAATDALAQVTDTPATGTEATGEQSATPTDQTAPAADATAPTEEPAAPVADETPVDQPADQTASTGTDAATGTDQAAPANPADNAAAGAPTDGSTPATPAADTTATVSLSLTQSTLTVGENTYTPDNKTFDTPANQELKFTVAPADGFAVSAVKQQTADGTETNLTANEVGEYTVAAADVADGLKLTVETAEVPAEPAEDPAEDPAAPVEDQPADNATTDETTDGDSESVEEEDAISTVDNIVEAVENGIGSVFSLDSENQQIEVALKSVGGEDFGFKTISLGDLAVAGATVAPEGYEYAYARVNNTDVKSVHYDAATSQFYVVADEGQLAGIAIEDTKQIVLYYTEYVPSYEIAYEVYVNDGPTPLPDESVAVDLLGNTTVKDGGVLEFSLAVREGYSLTQINPTSGQIKDGGSDGVYHVEGITENTTIKVYLEKQLHYNFTMVGSSNTQLELNGVTYNTSNKGSAGGWAANDVETTGYDVGQHLEFTLRGSSEHSQNDKALNKLVISIGSHENMGISIPFNEGDTATTNIDGFEITVNYTNHSNQGAYSNDYKVTVSREDGSDVVGDVELTTNFKDSTTSEIWGNNLVGVEWPQTVNNGTIGSSDQALDPVEHLHREINARSDTDVLFNILDGYTFQSGDQVTVTINGVEKTYTAYSIDSYQGQSGLSNGQLSQIKNDYDFWFRVPAEDLHSGRYGNDIRVNIVAKLETKTYGVQFTYDDGTGSVITDNNLSLGDNFFVSDGKDSFPAKEGYVFSGWQLGETIYNPGAIVSITDKTASLAQEGADGVYYFTFTPAWEDVEMADTALYTVNVFFANEAGAYSDNATAYFSESGVRGEEAFILTAELNERLAERAESSNLPENWDTAYVIDYSKSTPGLAVLVQADGTSVINIYFQQKATVTFEPGNHAANDEEATSVEVAKNSTVPVGQIPDYQAAENYEFIGWSSDDGETVLTDEQVAQQKITDNITFIAQWRQKIYDGDPITIQVVKDGQQISADGVITVGNWKDGTQGFDAKLEGNVYKVTYVYDNLNCADIELGVIVPTGYDVSVESDDMDVEPGVVDGTEKSCVISGSGASWTLDNVPPKSDATYTVHYVLDGTGTKLAEDKVETGKTFGEAYTENAVSIDGYRLADGEQSSKQVTAGYDDSDPRTNEVTFRYVADGDQRVTVTYSANNGTVDPASSSIREADADGLQAPNAEANEGYEFDACRRGPGGRGRQGRAEPRRGRPVRGHHPHRQLRAHY